MGLDSPLLVVMFVFLLNPCFVAGVRFIIKIKTGNITFAGTQARVYINVEGTTGNANSVYLGNDFDGGDIAFKDVDINVGRINKITVYHDNSGHNPGWYLDYIELHDISTGLKYTFKWNSWVRSGDRREINSKECYYNQLIDNCLVDPVRVECHIGRCTSCWDGFSIDGNKCIFTRTAEALTCQMKIIDKNNDERRSQVPHGQPNKCSNQRDFYGNLQVNHIDTITMFGLRVNVSHLDKSKLRYVTDYAFGVTDVYFHVVKKSLTGTEVITTFNIKEDAESKNPIHSVYYSKAMGNPIRNDDFENGQRLCLRMEVLGGGHADFRNALTGSTQLVQYPKTSLIRELCYWYDDAPPQHCLEHSSCGSEPLDTSSRILTSRDFTVTFTGWNDPSPVPGDSKFASGIHTYEVNMYEVKESGPDFLAVGRIPVIPEVGKDNSSRVNISIPSNLPNPSMYAVVLEVADVANNVRQARRFVIFDNSSTVMARNDKPFYSTAASQKTNHKWQTNLGQICYSWTDKYYNDKFHTLNLLKPIRDDPHGLISGVYEQTSGILPVSGTENIHGITRFYYTLGREGQILNQTKVPDFTSQTLCVSPKLTDGETYRLDLVAEDMFNHTYTDSLVTYIDASEPEIFDVWLVRDGYERLYVHYSNDLSKMILAFKSLDVHSGIYSVDWSLGTAFGGNDIGQGYIDILTANTNITCLDGVNPCYCPYVGDCLFYNFTLNLNSRLHSNASFGGHNHKYHFTITVTNIARLLYVKHLEILADDSPPAPGIVIEETTGSPDIDYTSEVNITATWAGIIDNESGIKLYKVGLSTKCLQITDVDHDTFINETTLTSANFSQRTVSTT